MPHRLHRPTGHTRRPVALAVAAALSAASLTSLTSLAGSVSSAHAATYTGPLASVHPVQPTTVADTASGLGAAKHALANHGQLSVLVAGVRGLPSAATSVTVAALVSSSTGAGQVRVGGVRANASAAVAAIRGRQSASSFTSLLSPSGRLYVDYEGTGKVQVRIVVEAYTSGDLTGSSLHPVPPARVADTWKGVGLPAHLLAKHAAVQVQIAGTAGIPLGASAVMLTVDTNSATGAGAITAGSSVHATAPVVAFTKGAQVTGSVLAPLDRNGKVTLVNSSPGKVGVTVNAVGYLTPDTTGLLFDATTFGRVLDTRSGLGGPKKPLSTALTLAVRAAAHLPAAAEAVALSLVTPAPGRSAVSAGAASAAMSTVLLTASGQAADTTTVVPLSPAGSLVLRATGKPVQAVAGVVGYWAPLPQSQPATTPPTPGPTTTAPVTAPPPTTPPTGPPTAQPQVHHPYVSGVDPADGSVNVDPGSTSVVTDLNLPNGGVQTGSLNAASVLLVADGGQQVAANYGTSGGGDTINLSPIGALAPNTWYTFSVTPGATDVTGVSFLPFSSRFKTGNAIVPDNHIAFDKYDAGASGQSFASLTKGPDGKLYASTLDGYIWRYTIDADGTLSNGQQISTVRDHAVAAGFYGAPTRTIIGLTFDPASTANNLILWVTDNSAYTGVTDPNNYIPDFSDHLAKLTGANLQTYTDVLSGLPRSVKDHETNSIAFDKSGFLYLSQGANNAMGQPDTTWGNRPEHLLNAAVLRLDVSKLPATLPLNVQTYDAGGSYDPYAANAPLTIYADGLRNAFDLVWDSNGHLYAPTNGSAAYGSAPASPAVLPAAACSHRRNGSAGMTSTPAAPFNPVAETDFVFDVKQGYYYGHPDPARCEYTLDGGNPTDGVDPYEVLAYKSPQQPDPNYDLADVYDAGLHASADGALEYIGSAFNGALNHKLLVVRYSDGQDIETFDVAADGKLSNRTVGTKGFTGFQSPLDIAEDNATGDLYVTETAGTTAREDIQLLKPRGANPAALLTVTNNSVIPGNDRLIFNRILSPSTSGTSVETTRQTDTLVLSATGAASVTVGSLPISGPFAVSGPATPFTIPAGGKVYLTVSFTATAGRISTGSLTIQTNASVSANRTIALAGFFQASSNLGEPTPADLASMMGWTTAIPTSINDAGTIRADGDEVLATTFSRIDPTQPVSVHQVAAFDAFPSSSTFAYYEPDATSSLTTVTTTQTTWSQSVLPANLADSTPATGIFYPTEPRFGLNIDGESSDDTLNDATADHAAGCVGTCGHHLRVFPVVDSSGHQVVGSYFVVVDRSGAGEDYDYNDAAYLVSNIQP